MDIANDVAPWRIGVVTQVERNKVTVGFRPSKLADGRIPAERQGVEVFYDEIKWANLKPSKTPGPADVLGIGDVIWVAPKDPDAGKPE